MPDSFEEHVKLMFDIQAAAPGGARELHAPTETPHVSFLRSDPSGSSLAHLDAPWQVADL